MRRSGYLRVWCEALSIRTSSQARKVSHRTANCRQKSGSYNCLFCFQGSVFHQRPLNLLNLQQLIPFTVAFCYPNSESLCLQLGWECWLLLDNFWRDCYHRASSPSHIMFDFYPLPHKGAAIYLSRDSYVITSKVE